MYCLRCGYKNEENATVCKNCNTNIQESQSRYNYDYSRNDHHDQMIYSYKYSNNGKMPERQENDCDDQLDYRYRYSYGTNPPKTNYNTSDNQYSYSEKYLYANSEYDTSSDFTTDLIAGDEKYFKAYIGPTYNLILKQKFSFLTLIFGPFYFLQKRMFIYSLLWIFGLLVIGYYQPNILEISYFLINLFIATKFKKIYIGFVDKKIEKIKLQSLDLTTDEIIKKCQNKGGQVSKTTTTTYKKTSKSPTLAIILFFVFMFAGTFIPVMIELMDSIGSDLYYEEQVNENLEYVIPYEYVQTYNTQYNKSYKFETTNNYSIIEIYQHYSIEDYMTAEEYLLDHVSMQPTPYIRTTNINNHIWTTTTYGNTTYYATLLDTKAYIIMITIHKDIDGNCNRLINEFVNSLRITY